MKGRIIKQTNNEGEIFIKYLESRLIRNNKNVLGAELGPTGSGKSYRDLRKAELWYNHHFKEDFPVENICFGVPAIMELLSKGKLRKGEIIIFEEAGANLGSLDFQNKVSKMMTYVLQSFRSMNIAIFFNLPYLSMLNKQARMLLHYSFESVSVDKQNKINKCKPFFHQVAQGTGKIYKKYPLVRIKGKTRKVKRFSFLMPSKYLVDAYETKKAAYLKNLTTSFHNDLKEMTGKMPKSVPSEKDFEMYNRNVHLKETQQSIAEDLNLCIKTVNVAIQRVRKWQEIQQRVKNEKENALILQVSSSKKPLNALPI